MTHEAALHLFGVTLIGATPENGRRLLLTLGFILAVVAAGRAIGWCVARVTRDVTSRRAAFWSRQIVNIITAAALMLGVVSIWFDDPSRLATAFGLVTAGLAFALQRVVTATAGYLIILRGSTFNVGDRIVMGGVRGDVMALSFMQTTILEMGEPASVTSVSSGPSSTWVHSRQYTGRVVTVSNAKIFDEPVYNYSREFPFLWEEMALPVPYGADRKRAEQILLETAIEHAGEIAKAGSEQAKQLQQRFSLATSSVAPRVYVRLTDDWVELAVRFLTRTHGVRELKSAMSRDILDRFKAEGLTIAAKRLDWRPSVATSGPERAGEEPIGPV